MEKCEDKDSNQLPKSVVVAHPDLPRGQIQLLQDEYLGGAVSRMIEVRRCLLGYTVQDLRLATDPVRHTPPEFQLLLENANELKNDFGISGVQSG